MEVAREADKKVIAVEEPILLDEGRGMEEGWWDVVEGKVVLVVVSGVLVEMHWEKNLLEATETGFLSSFFEC